MRCKYCTAVWGGYGHMTSCGMEYDDFGCYIFGIDRGAEDDHCPLTKAQVEKRLKELDDYEHGRIERPQWLANRFIADMDRAIATFPGFPPKRPRIRSVVSDFEGEFSYAERERLISTVELHDEMKSAYRRGYKDAKAGKESRPEFWKTNEEVEEWDILD